MFQEHEWKTFANNLYHEWVHFNKKLYVVGNDCTSNVKLFFVVIDWSNQVLHEFDLRN